MDDDSAPLPETQDKQELDRLVGLAVKAERSQVGMTLAELSARSGVSAPMISKIERGQVSASLSTLNALARAVGVPIINFFSATVEVGEVSLVRAGQGTEVRRAGSTYGHSYKQLGQVESGGIDFQGYLITLDAPVNGTPIFQHSGIEFLHILDGGVTYRVGDTTYDLAEGDTLTFEATAPHGPVHIEKAKSVFLTVIARPKANFT